MWFRSSSGWVSTSNYWFIGFWTPALSSCGPMRASEMCWIFTKHSMRPTQQKQWQFSNTVNKQDEREREREDVVIGAENLVKTKTMTWSHSDIWPSTFDISVRTEWAFETKSEDILSQCSWDITFTNIGWTSWRHETRCLITRGVKVIVPQHMSQHQMKFVQMWDFFPA